MTVAELIEALLQMPQDVDVHISSKEWGYSINDVRLEAGNKVNITNMNKGEDW